MALARSTGLSGMRLALVACVVVIVSSETSLMGLSAGGLAWAPLVLVTLLSSIVPTFLNVADSVSSNQSAEVLGLLGARRSTIVKATLLTVVGYGAAGSLGGAVFGLAASGSLLTSVTPFGSLGAFITEASVVGSCVGGVAIGVVMGVVFSWKRKD